LKLIVPFLCSSYPIKITMPPVKAVKPTYETQSAALRFPARLEVFVAAAALVLEPEVPVVEVLEAPVEDLSVLAVVPAVVVVDESVVVMVLVESFVAVDDPVVDDPVVLELESSLPPPLLDPNTPPCTLDGDWESPADAAFEVYVSSV
jgi:hypothetical protein